MSLTFPTAVLLAAGESSRFWPLSTHGHKSLHRLCGKAIIEHTVESLVSAGVTDIVIVQSPKTQAAHRSIENQLGDGAAYGAAIRYVTQPEPLGQGDGLLRAAHLLGRDFLVIQPENINAGELVNNLMKHDGNVITLQEKDETWLFGVCAVEGDTVTGIVEKPEPGTEPSKLCNMWVAKLTPDYLKALQSVPADPISSVTALGKLANAGELQYVISEHPFFPLKYPWHLFAMADHLKPEGKPYIGKNVTVDPTATISNDSAIENDATIGPNTVVTRSIIGAGSKIASSITDTILGAAVVIKPAATIRHQPLDGGHVTVDVKGDQIDTDLAELGIAVGHGSVIEGAVTVSAGVLIGAESIIKKSVNIDKNIPDTTTVSD
ncbi:hypothetical protein EXS54_02540 [Patescibacteria group bacterium]|nr:hypothetical protein [Patescibacteria group bacterium]